MTRVDDFTPEARAYPLYTRELLDVGVAVQWHHPDVDLADRVIERLAPGLDDVGRSVSGGEPSAAIDTSFMQAALAEQADLRRAFFDEIAEVESAAWEYIDRAAYSRAVARYGALRHPELRLLHGAAGGVLWASYLGMSRQGWSLS